MRYEKMASEKFVARAIADKVDRAEIAEAVSAAVAEAFSENFGKVLAGQTINTNTTNAMRQAIKTIGAALGATMRVLLLFAALPLAGATVQTAPLGELDLDAGPAVVTNVTFDGLATDSALYDATHVVATNQTSPAYTASDVWTASWDASVFRPAGKVGDADAWASGSMLLMWETNLWTLAGATADPLFKSAPSNNTTVAFGTVDGVRYTLTRRGSYSVVTNTTIDAAKAYTDTSANNAITVVAGMMELGKRQVVSEIEEYVCASPMELPAAAAAKGTSFNCGSADASGVVCGEDQNGAIEIGRGAKARVKASALTSAKSNTAARAVGIAIGEYADATVSDSSARSQQIAIGFHAQAKQSNDIAIGSGAQHTFEDSMSGPAAYANGGEAIAMGYTAKSVARRAVQIGIGTNSTANTLQFLNHTLVDADGQVPMDRLRLAERELGGGLVGQLRRIVSPGNTHAIGNGIDCDEPGHPVIEPRLQGVTEITFGTGTNGLYNAGTYIEVAPPLGSRNYELVITNLPQSVWTSNAVGVVDGVAVTNVVPVDIPRLSNFMMDFGPVAETRSVEIRCAPSIGYRRFDSAVVVTNAPLIVKVREPSTNTVWVVVKPWDPMEDL